MKKRILSTLLALALAVGLLAMPASAEDWSDDLDTSYSSVFSDVSTDYWAYRNIERAFIAGAMNGVSYDAQTGVRTFAPKGKLTVVQFLAIVVRGGYRYELWMNETSAEGDWSAPYVAVAREYGLLDGLEDINLKGYITRYQMAQILNNGWRIELTPERLAEVKDSIADWDSIPEQYREAVAAVYAVGIINGKGGGVFDGAANMTRAEAAAVYCRMADNFVTRPGVLGGAACGEGEWLRTQWFDFKVIEGGRMHSWSDWDSETGWQNWEPQEGCQFVTLLVSLLNHTDETIPMSCNEFLLWWGTGEDDWDLPAVSMTDEGGYDVLGGDHMPMYFELEPGESWSGWLVYMAPDGLENFMLTYVEEFADGTYGDKFYVELALNHPVG